MYGAVCSHCEACSCCFIGKYCMSHIHFLSGNVFKQETANLKLTKKFYSINFGNFQTYPTFKVKILIALCSLKRNQAVGKEATSLHPPLPVFAPARVSFRLLSLSPVCTKDSPRDQTVAGKVAAV